MLCFCTRYYEDCAAPFLQNLTYTKLKKNTILVVGWTGACLNFQVYNPWRLVEGDDGLYQPNCHPNFQCDQIGLFSKVLGSKFTYKSSPNIGKVLGHIRNQHFLVKTSLAAFWPLFLKFRLLFNPKSCHTESILVIILFGLFLLFWVFINET